MQFHDQNLFFQLSLFVSTNQYWCNLNTVHQSSEDLQIAQHNVLLSTEQVFFTALYSEVCSKKLIIDKITHNTHIRLLL